LNIRAETQTHIFQFIDEPAASDYIAMSSAVKALTGKIIWEGSMKHQVRIFLPSPRRNELLCFSGGFY